MGALIGTFTLAAAIPAARPLIYLMGSPELFVVMLWGLSMVAVLGGSPAYQRIDRRGIRSAARHRRPAGAERRDALCLRPTLSARRYFHQHHRAGAVWRSLCPGPGSHQARRRAAAGAAQREPVGRRQGRAARMVAGAALQLRRRLGGHRSRARLAGGRLARLRPRGADR